MPSRLHTRPPVPLVLAAALALLGGCGTTRMTDTQRTATEQLLVSHAIDQAVSHLDFNALAGKAVFFDPQYLDGTVDRGYLVSSLRQHLLANGCLLQEERGKAAYVVEARSGGIGTDRNSLLIGIPQMNVPALVPGQPSQIPEIPLAKKNDQRGVAKVAVFGYNRQTGQAVWQSGVVQATSTAKDTWLLGAGPFRRGTIRSGTEFAGQPLPLASLGDAEAGSNGLPVTRSAVWPEARPAGLVSRSLARVLANAYLDDPLPLADPVKPPAPESKAFATPPPTPNTGGHAETEPAKVISSSKGFKPDG